MPNEELRSLLKQVDKKSDLFAEGILANPFDVPRRDIAFLEAESQAEILAVLYKVISSAHTIGFLVGRGIDMGIAAEEWQND